MAKLRRRRPTKERSGLRRDELGSAGPEGKRCPTSNLRQKLLISAKCAPKYPGLAQQNPLDVGQ